MGIPDQNEKRLEDFNDVFADIYNVLVFKKQVLEDNKLMAGPTESILDTDTDDLIEQRRDEFKTYGDLEPISKFYCGDKNGVNLRLASFGIENQTTIDSLMPLRCLSYDVGSYRQQVKDNETLAKKYKKRNYPVKILSPVITIVLNFTEKQWNTNKTLKDMVDIPDELKPYSSMIQDYKMQVFDIAFLEDDVINSFQSDFRIIARFFKDKRLCIDNNKSSVKLQHVIPVLRFFKAMTGQDEFEDLAPELLSMVEKGDDIQMCTFTQGLVDRGVLKEKQAMVIKLIKYGMSDIDIANLVGFPVTTIKKVRASQNSSTKSMDLF